VVVAKPVLDKMQIDRYGNQTTNPRVYSQRIGNVGNAELPRCAFISWAWR